MTPPNHGREWGALIDHKTSRCLPLYLCTVVRNPQPEGPGHEGLHCGEWAAVGSGADWGPPQGM